jgi:hypothetical protein
MRAGARAPLLSPRPRFDDKVRPFRIKILESEVTIGLSKDAYQPRLPDRRLPHDARIGYDKGYQVGSDAR